MFDDIFDSLNMNPVPQQLPPEITTDSFPNDEISYLPEEVSMSPFIDPFVDPSVDPTISPSVDPSGYAPPLGTPTEDAAHWHPQEGSNSCAVVAQLSVYEAITGIELSEDAACQIAQANGWYDPEAGTSPQDMGRLLAAFGIPTTQTYDATLEDIAVALEQGDKVIVGLDANEIWHPTPNATGEQPVELENAGHAVWVTGMRQEADGSIKIILNDSGTETGQMKEVDAIDFINAWQDYGNFLVVADTPTPTHWV
jgi:hypothetical protein